MTIRTTVPCSTPKGSAVGWRRTSMGMIRCGRRLRDRGFSSVRQRSRLVHETSSALTALFSRRMSRTIEDRRQSTLMLAFPAEVATYRGEALSQRKDVAGDDQVVIL